MEVNTYKTKCKFSEIDSIQETAEIMYSATFESEEISIIEIIKTNSKSTTIEKFKCQISFCNCIGLITYFKENCIYPVHCKDIMKDFGYRIFSVA